jgi:hypothetical protein
MSMPLQLDRSLSLALFYPLSQQITLRFFCHYWQLEGLTLFHLSNNMNVLGSISFPMDALFL